MNAFYDHPNHLFDNDCGSNCIELLQLSMTKGRGFNSCQALKGSLAFQQNTMEFNWTWIPGYLLVVFSAIGNSLVIFLISTRRNIRTTTNWFVLSLAVADLGVAVAWYPVLSVCTKTDDQMECTEEFASIASFIVGLFVLASVTNLCALTLDRYLAIVHPLRYVTFMTKRRMRQLILGAWAGPSSLCVSYMSVHVLSSEESHKSATFHETIVVVFITALFVFAGIFLLFTAVRIVLVVRRIARRNAALIAQLNFNHQLRPGVAFKARETASAKMIGIVVAVCLVCYLWNVLYIISLLVGSSFPLRVADVVSVFVVFNSAVNPVAYAFHKREIKRELRRLFRNRGQHGFPTNSGGREVQREHYDLRVLRNTVTPQWGLHPPPPGGLHRGCSMRPTSFPGPFGGPKGPGNEVGPIERHEWCSLLHLPSALNCCVFNPFTPKFKQYILPTFPKRNV